MPWSTEKVQRWGTGSSNWWKSSFELSIERKPVVIQAETRQSYFATEQCSATWKFVKTDQMVSPTPPTAVTRYCPPLSLLRCYMFWVNKLFCRIQILPERLEKVVLVKIVAVLLLFSHSYKIFTESLSYC